MKKNSQMAFCLEMRHFLGFWALVESLILQGVSESFWIVYFHYLILKGLQLKSSQPIAFQRKTVEVKGGGGAEVIIKVTVCLLSTRIGCHKKRHYWKIFASRIVKVNDKRANMTKPILIYLPSSPDVILTKSNKCQKPFKTANKEILISCLSCRKNSHNERAKRATHIGIFAPKLI